MKAKSNNETGRSTNAACPHAASCFDCPLPDCIMPDGMFLNEILPVDFMKDLFRDDRVLESEEVEK